MRTPIENKNALAGFDATCPKCSGPARPLPNGVFCPSDYFIEDTSTRLRSTPDPISEALRTDPERLAAQAKMDEAQAAYDAAYDNWHRVMSELQEVRIKAQHDEGEFDGLAGGWRPSRKVRTLRRREAELTEELEIANRNKEHMSGNLSRARRNYREAAAAASTRLGRPAVTGNARGGDRTLVIPQT